MEPLDLGINFSLATTKIIQSLMQDGSSIQDQERKIRKMEEQIRNLEEERKKVEVFKRDLPFCKFLLNDVIKGMKIELEKCRRRNVNGLEGFIPAKSSKSEEEEKHLKFENDRKDKMNWMSSVQLWSDHYSKRDDDDNNDKSTEPRISMAKAGSNRDAITSDVGLPDLSLVPYAAPATAPPVATCHLSDPGGSHVSIHSQQQLQQASRKARRCWSPELHRRFVAALQELGGARVATPKQIRELMKVDGLTNDEVKSHLQKYRLYARRESNTRSETNNGSVMLMGGLLIDNEQMYAKMQQTESPQGPLQFTSSSRAVTSVTNGDSCDDDGKSESCSWK